MTKHVWLKNLKLFFENRAASMDEKDLTVDKLALVSGRDYRLWRSNELFEDLIACIGYRLELTQQKKLFEVGCAAGFLARALAPKVKSYMGVDISKKSINLAKSLNIVNAKFQWADAVNLPFDDGKFECVLCQDVFTNIANMDIGGSIIHEIVRVTKPGGRAIIGNVAYKGKDAESGRRFAEVSREMEEKHGPYQFVAKSDFWTQFGRWFKEKVYKCRPEILCYSYSPSEFHAVGNEMGVKMTTLDIHPKSYYWGLRFDILIEK